MKLSLARSSFRAGGNSAGHWLIRQVPGMCVCHTRETPEAYQGKLKQGWIIIYTGVQFSYARERGIWPSRDEDRERNESLSSNWPNPVRVFKTRREALNYLERQIAEKPNSTLSELLGKAA